MLNFRAALISGSQVAKVRRPWWMGGWVGGAVRLYTLQAELVYLHPVNIQQKPHEAEMKSCGSLDLKCDKCFDGTLTRPEFQTMQPV